MKQQYTLLLLFLFAAFSFPLSARPSGAPYTIPIVVHIVHDNGPENISDSLVRDAIAEVNRNFNAQNTSLSGVASPFISTIGNMQIEFCLAHTDPQGQPSTGIEHIANPLTYYGDSLAVRINQWPPDRYMNIWVVDSFAHDYPGIASGPDQAAADPAHDGAVAGHFAFAAGRRGMLTNVLAHYLNLENTWGNTNEPEIACGDDDVNDTPVTKGSFTNCDTSTKVCDLTVIENVQNFMNYAPCTCMFTQGQVTRVHEALDSTLAHRNNLWSPANLATTCAGPTTGISEATSTEISIGPNPFSTDINVQGLHAAEQCIQLCDMLGQQIVEEPHSRTALLHFAGLAPGIYTLIIHDGIAVKSFKVIKM